MEAELVPHGILSPGNVSSTLPYNLLPVGAARDAADEIGSEASDHCLIAVSPWKGLVVLVSGRVAQFLTAGGQHPSGTLGLLYKTVWQGLLPVVLEADLPPPTPTAVAVFPVVVHGGKTQQIENIVVAGFSDGGLRFYKSNGQLIFSHTLHKEAIRKISTSVPVKHGTRTIKQDELLVLYQSVLCVVSGPSMVQCLRESMNRDLMAEGAEAHSLPSLSHRKWFLQQQTETCDVVSLVSCAVPMFDQLSELSKVKGPDANPRSISTYDRKLISVGSQPMIALYNVSKDAGTIQVAEVVSAIASAMTSVVVSKFSSWWSGRSDATTQTTQRQPQRVENTLGLSMSCNLPDPARRVTAAWPSPCGRLIVTADDYGRVLLLDAMEFVVLRIWKGYRNAQCGWIEVGKEEAQAGGNEERGSSGEERKEAAKGGGRRCAQTALCLCIFASRRGILELWPVQHGPKIATFQVGKTCRLIDIRSVLFGVPQGDSQWCGSTNVMLITAEGQLVELSVPQHLLLRSGRSHSRDLLLLRKLPHATTSGDTDLIATAFSTLQSSRIILKGVDVLLRECPSSSIPLHFVVQMMSKVLGRLSQGTLTPTVKQFRSHLMKLRQLVAVFVFLQDANRKCGQERSYYDLMREKLVDKCSIPPAASGSLTTALNSYFKSLASQKLDIPKPLTLREFVNCFSSSTYSGPDLQLPRVSHEVSHEVPGTRGEESGDRSPEVKGAVREKEDSARVEVVQFHPKLDGASLVRLGAMLFKPIVCHNCKHDAFVGAFQGSGLNGSDLLTALIAAWLSKQMSPGHSPFGSLEGLREALTTVCGVRSEHGLKWSDISQHCRETTHFGHALLLAVAAYSFARGEAEDTAREVQKGQAVHAAVDSWEAVSEGDDDWLHLLQELEFFTRFTLLTGSEHVTLFPAMPALSLRSNGSLDLEKTRPVTKVEDEESRVPPPLTVVHCKQSGMEVVSQALASWAVSKRANPCLLEIMDSYKQDIEMQLTQAEQSLVPKLRQLVQCSPVPLSADDMHVKCVWQACAHWQLLLTESVGQRGNKGQMGILPELDCALQHLLLITSPQLMMATGHLMWIVVYRSHMKDIIECVKKPGNLSPSDPLLVSAARQLMGVLAQLFVAQPDSLMHTEGENVLDTNNAELTTLLLKADPLNKKLVELHYSILLCLELVTNLHLDPIRLFSVFDVWVRECFGSNLEEELVEKKGRSLTAMKHQQLKFLTKALTALITAPPKALPAPYLKPNSRKQGVELPRVLLNSWTDLVYHVAELMVPLLADETKVSHVWLLYTAGLDQTAEEVLKGVPGSKMLSERLIQAAGQRLGRLLSEETQTTRKARALAHVSPQVLEWISQQSFQKVHEAFPVKTPTWGTSQSFLNTISNTCELSAYQQAFLQSLHALVLQFTTKQP